MSWHDHIGIDPQAFILYTEVQAISDNLTRGLINEYWQPFHDGEADIIQSHSRDDAITFHADIIFPLFKPLVNSSARLDLQTGDLR